VQVSCLSPGKPHWQAEGHGRLLRPCHLVTRAVAVTAIQVTGALYRARASDRRRTAPTVPAAPRLRLAAAGLSDSDRAVTVAAAGRH
jgi:hypothetical protein